ncbi:MAG: BatD family protein [Candidatus Babeliales bacterium]
MISIVGKAWFIGSVLLLSSCMYATVTLKVKDLNGIVLKEVAAGYPCTIELTIDDAQRRMENPEIKGLDQFHLEGRETSMQMINGKTTVTYGFRARCNKPGSYTIGPAKLSIEGTEYTSNVVPLTVVAAPTANAHTDDTTVFARLRCTKKQVVVGEKVGVSIRFYYTNHDYLLRDVGNPPEKGYTRKEVQGPFSGTEVIDGVMYHYVEWTWDMYPTKPGVLTIPAYSFDYDTPKTEGQDHVFAGFSLFFNRQRYDRHRVYSNSCELEVDHIPEVDNEAVQGVGHCTAFTARITPAHVTQGDGMVLTLELTGDADFDAVTLNSLKLPDVFKWYDSQTLPVQDAKGGQRKKSWEYIVQGLKPGTFEIPAQRFTYFDTKKRTVVTLATSPQSVTITSALQETTNTKKLADAELPHQEQQRAENEPVASLAQAVDIVDPSGLRPIHESGQWYAHQERSVPLWLYVLLMALPISFVIARWFLNNYSGWLHAVARKRYLFKQARAQLARAELVGNGAVVYPLFISILSSCLSIPESMVTDEFIEQAFKNAGLNDAQCNAWKQFFVQAAAYAFYAENNKQRAPDDFFQQAAAWLDVCEKQL